MSEGVVLETRHPTISQASFVIVFEAVGHSCQLPKASWSEVRCRCRDLSLLSLRRGATEANAGFEDKMHMMGKYWAAEGSSEMFSCRDVLLPFF